MGFMNRTLKTGLIGFSSTIALAILLRFTLGMPTVYIAPFALPWGMVIIIGALKRKTPESKNNGNRSA